MLLDLHRNAGIQGGTTLNLEPTENNGALVIPKNRECNLEAGAMIERYQQFLRRRCRLLMNGNKEDADDLFSQIVIKVLLEDPAKLRSITHPGGWLARMAQNQCTDVFRQRQSDTRRGERFAQLLSLLETPPLSPEDLLIRSELIDRIERALAELPLPLRRVAELRFIQDHSYDSIAAELAISEANARKRVQKARKELAALLLPYLGDKGIGA